MGARAIGIISFKANAELRSEAAKTYFGIIWWILDPVLYMAVFYVVFSQWRENAGESLSSFCWSGLCFSAGSPIRC